MIGTSWDHLRDELELLNACLLAEVQNRAQKNSQLDSLQGLILTEREIIEILSQPLDRVLPPNTEKGLQDLKALEVRLGRGDQSPQQASLEQLTDLFQLETIERLCLLLCLAPEIDARYARVFAFLQDDLTRKQPSIELALRLFCKDIPEALSMRSIFTAGSPLFRNRLIDFAQPASDKQLPLSQRSLRVDDRIAAFLLQTPQVDDCLVNWVELIQPSNMNVRTAVPALLVERTLRLVESCFSGKDSFHRPLIHLYGRRGSGRRSLATLASHHVGLPLLGADLRKLPNAETPETEVLWRLCREALLLPAVLLIENFDDLLQDGRQRELAALVEAAHYFSPVSFLSGKQVWRPANHKQFFLSLECPVPDATSRVDFWRQHLTTHATEFEDPELVELSSKFAFTSGQIHQTVKTAQHRAYWEDGTTSELTPKLINDVARGIATPTLMGLARKVETRFSWSDIVLPDNQLVQLKEIASHARRSQIIFERWGFAKNFSYGRGIAALFEGQSGTGKTMAASIVAGALSLDVYQIDLSCVVSKYIGETEKNLSRIFEEAQDSNAILFFDEADALFGKRSEVKNAHDRYANIEVAYLLQKMEDHDGVVILATNLSKNMDDAFSRRMHYVVEFPLPNAVHRERLWRGMFPPEAPLAPDVDFKFLADQFPLSGGDI